MNTESVFTIIFLVVVESAFIALLIFLNKICNFLEDKLYRISGMNFIWDQTIFARRYVFGLQSKYFNGTKELAKRNVYLYVLATRPYLIPGVVCILYVVIKSAVSGDFISSFLDFTKNTIAGNALDYWHILRKTYVFDPWSYVLAGIINLISLFIIRRRYDEKIDGAALGKHRLIRIGSFILTTVSFFAIQLVLSELFDPLTRISFDSLGSVPFWIWALMVVLLLPFLISAIYYLLKAVFSWFSEMVQALTACVVGLAILAAFAYTIGNRLGEVSDEVNQMIAVVIIIIAYSAIKGVRYLLYKKKKKKSEQRASVTYDLNEDNKDSNDMIVWDNTYFPRVIVAKNWLNYKSETGTEIPGYICIPK